MLKDANWQVDYSYDTVRYTGKFYSEAAHSCSIELVLMTSKTTSFCEARPPVF